MKHLEIWRQIHYLFGQCKTQTVDCGLRTADQGLKCRLQTETKMQARVKCRLSINCSRGRVKGQKNRANN